MSRTSRTAHAATAVRPLVPSLMLLPLLVGAFLVGLWMFGAASASAEETAPSQGTLGAGTLLRDSVAGKTRNDGSPLSSALGQKAPASLDEVVTDEIVEPVSSTLGGLHQRLEQGAERTVAVLPEASLSMDGVRENARRVVGELEHGAAEDLLAPVPSAADAPSPLSQHEGREAEAASLPSADRSEPDTAHVLALDHQVRPLVPAAFVEDSAYTAPDSGSTHEPAPQTSAPSVVQLTTGSSPHPAASAPTTAVAGYLTPSPVTAPSAGTVLFAAHGLYPVPSGPSDDLTVSPD